MYISLIPETFLTVLQLLFSRAKQRGLTVAMHNAQDARWKSMLRFSADIRENKFILKERSLRIQHDRGSTARQADKTIIHDSRQLHQSWEESRVEGRREVKGHGRVPVLNYYSRVCLPTSGNDLTGRSWKRRYILPAFCSILFSRTFCFVVTLRVPQGVSRGDSLTIIVFYMKFQHNLCSTTTLDDTLQFLNLFRHKTYLEGWQLFIKILIRKSLKPR